MAARHRVIQSVGAPGGTQTASCECGVTGPAFEVAEHVRRYASIQAAPDVKVGRMRSGRLTREAERVDFDLSGLDERVFVLVTLPAGQAVPSAIEAAYGVLAGVLAGAAAAEAAQAQAAAEVDELRRAGKL